jgi:hypothetical protein
VVVSRPSVYGNPFIVEHDGGLTNPWVVFWSDAGPVHSYHPTKTAAATTATQCFADWATQDTLDPKLWSNLLIVKHVALKAALLRGDLVGKDVACWCALDQACHGDPLLRLANPEVTG